MQGARPTSQADIRSPLLWVLLQQHQQQGQQAAAPPPEEGEEEAVDAQQGPAALARCLQQLLDAFLQHWQPQDTAAVLHPTLAPKHNALLRQWLLQERARTLDPLLAVPAARNALGQAAVNERDTPLLELLLEELAFSSQGELNIFTTLSLWNRALPWIDRVRLSLDRTCTATAAKPSLPLPLLLPLQGCTCTAWWIASGAPLSSWWSACWMPGPVLMHWSRCTRRRCCTRCVSGAAGCF